MASRPSYVLAKLALCLMSLDVTMAQSLPADQAENAVASHARAGWVRPGADGVVARGAIEAAVRADAARAWQLHRPDALKVGVEELNWADASLGCPRPGMAYTQALVPGYRLVVREGQREAVYHASRRGHWLWCPGAPVSGLRGEAEL
ncbi:hypothetical protein [Roseateles asaccharophilus]|uniref:Uncharacterized protein n=1 Tax=Roseateles asaccharophilus TaxID=582607 RepID=A0ABU2ADB2_9BURK|nr:hypothetical protein [Roseateles asaccharophilus]MDR7335191.1 hypothetical protein [Roseateles asaccharophilus]